MSVFGLIFLAMIGFPKHWCMDMKLYPVSVGKSPIL